MKGILADVHMGAYVDALIREMQSESWIDFWKHLGLKHFHFADLGLTPTSTDLEIWTRCQTEQIVFITNNRNKSSLDSLEAVIRSLSGPDSLPVFTIGNLARLAKSKEYAQRVVDKIYQHLLDIENLRGTGRLFLP